MHLRRATFVLALTLGLLSCAGAQLQLNATATAVTDHQTIGLTVRLVNTDPAPRDVQLQLALPAGWQTLIPPSPRTLAPGEDTIEIIVLRVPRSARAGTHTVGVTVGDVKAEASVQVPQRDAVNVHALASTVTNGQVTASFQVRNDGNAPARVDLSAAGLGKPRVNPATLDLAPGEVRTVQVTGPVPPELAKYGVTVRARTAGVTAQASIAADVLSPAADSRSAWLTLPAAVQIEAGQGGPQVRFSADGAVAPGVNVHLRADAQDFNVAVQTPEARVALGNAAPGFSSFAVHPPSLALQGELGTGTIGSTTARAYVGLRRDLQGSPLAGLELSRRYGWGDARVGVDASSGSVTTTLAARVLITSLTAGGELGIRHDGVAIAVAADTTRKDNPLGLSRAGGSVTYRTPGFDSNAAGLATLEMHTQGQINGFGIGARLAGALELAPGNAVSGRTLDLALSAQDPRWSLLGGLKWSERPATEEATLTTGVSAAYRFAGGQLQQAITDQQSFRAGNQVSSSLKYDVGLDYTFGNDVNTFVVKPKATVAFDLLSGMTRVGGSLEGQWVGESGTRVNVSVSQPDFSQQGLFLSAGVEHQLENGITLLASASQYVGATSSTSLRVAARIPLEVPLYLRPDIGSVEGRVLDGSGQGVAGMTVQAISYLAVTDAQGTYRFPALPVGDHVLQVRASTGQWCTPPQAVTVLGRQVTRQDLACVPAVTTTGRLVEHPVGGDVRAPLELPGILVALTGPLGRFEATSDASGRLVFGDLPAGTYALEITPAAPALLRNLTPEAPGTMDLTAGLTELSFPFARKPRVIQMQDEQPVVVPLTPLPGAPAEESSGAP